MGAVSHQRCGWGREKKKKEKNPTPHQKTEEKKISSCGLQPAAHGWLRKAVEKSQPVVSGLNSLHRHPLPAGKPPANLTRRKKTPCFSPKRRTRRVEEPALRPREGQRLSEINRNRNRREKGLPRGKPALLLRAAERRGLFSLARPGGNPTLSQRGALLLFPASPRSSARGHELCLGFLSSRGICRVGGGGGCGALIHPKSSRRSKVKL